MSLYPKLTATVELLSAIKIPSSRVEILQDIINHINKKRDVGEMVKLNFICTHNSRRSQMAQVWAQTAAAYYNIPVKCYSGGVESTEFNTNAVDTLLRVGFKISKEGEENPAYEVRFSDDSEPVYCCSKVYDDASNPQSSFAAIVTCSDADENCPYIPGAEKRISLRYEDPKEFDNTALMREKYAERSRQIGREMFYVFSKINS